MLPEPDALPDGVSDAVPDAVPDNQGADNCDPDAPYPGADCIADIAANSYTHAADRRTEHGANACSDARADA
jgi:hypothetical protein